MSFLDSISEQDFDVVPNSVGIIAEAWGLVRTFIDYTKEAKKLGENAAATNYMSGNVTYNMAIYKCWKARRKMLNAIQDCKTGEGTEPESRPENEDGTTPGDTDETTVGRGLDPNDKQTIGAGDEHWIAPDMPIVYTVRFENMATASLPAQQVVITDQLDANLDWSTFELLNISFNNTDVVVPPGLQTYATQTHVATDPNPVLVEASLNAETGVVQWVMTTVDPITGELIEDPLPGFLPPNNDLHQGEGSVMFTVFPAADSADGTVIENTAEIVFDVNEPIVTNTVSNRVDFAPPVTEIDALPLPVSDAVFDVHWHADDGTGSGVATYYVYASEDGGEWSLWQDGVTRTSAVFTGEHGRDYAFFAVATDAAGNAEPDKPQPDAQTSVDDTTGPRVAALDPPEGAGNTTSRSIFRITFHEPVDPVTATDPATYAMIGAGPDGVFDDGDDGVVPVNEATVDETGRTVSVTVNDGKVLPTDTYMLLVYDALTDRAGNSLDGDNDGTPGGDFMAEYDLIAPVDAAYRYIIDCMDEFHDAFDVYTDADAAGNHFSPTGFANGDGNLAVNARWTGNPARGSSCLRLEFTGETGADGLPWNEFSFEEPEGCGEGSAGPGYDLSGATTLSFQARTDTPGAVLTCGHGDGADSSRQTRTFVLAKDWNTYTLDLTGLDMSQIHIGFYCTFNEAGAPDPGAVAIYLDDIRYDLARPDKPRLVRSVRTAGDTDAFDIQNKNAAGIYDNATALIALLSRGVDEDVVRATLIADALVHLHEHDTDVFAPVPRREEAPFTGHRLRGAYAAGDLTDARGDPRLPGWWNDESETWSLHPDALSYTTGDLAWVILALVRSWEVTEVQDYRDAAVEMADWIESNCKRTGDGESAGYHDGWRWDREAETWRSQGVTTAANQAVTAAFAALARSTENAVWQAAAAHAGEFVQAMWDVTDKYFKPGLGLDGTPLETTPTDCQTWGALLMAEAPYWQALDWAANHCALPPSERRSTRALYDSDDDSPDTASHESSATMALAQRERGHDADAALVLAGLHSAQIQARHADDRGLAATDVHDLRSGDKHRYHNRLALTPTAWFALAEQQSNPLRERALRQLSLKTQWNLVSIPVAGKHAIRELFLAGDRRSSVKQGIVWTWDADSKVYRSMTDGDFLKPGQAYWVFSPAGGRMRLVFGEEPEGPVRVWRGWNHVGPVRRCGVPDPAATPALTPVWRWDSSWQRLEKVGDEALLLPGEAYWIYCTESGDLHLK